MNNKQTRSIIGFSLLFLAAVIIVAVIFFSTQIETWRDPATWRNIAVRFPVLAPLLIITVIVVEVVLAPLPGGFIPLITGFLFGTLNGTVYSWIGNVLGALFAWWLANFFGRPFVKKLVKKDSLLFYDSFIHKRKYIIWLFYLIPLFPIDIISLAIGLSKTSFKKFAIIISIALLPNMWLLNFFGNRIYETNLVYIFLFAAGILLMIIIYSLIKEWRMIKNKSKPAV